MKLTKLETEVLLRLSVKPASRLWANGREMQTIGRLVKKDAVRWYRDGTSLCGETQLTPAGRAYLATLDAKEAAK